MVIVYTLDVAAAGFYGAHGFVLLPSSLRLVLAKRGGGAYIGYMQRFANASY